MHKNIDLSFKVTPSQKESIDARVLENGFDDLSAYLKVVALKTQNFIFTNAANSSEDASISLGFSVNESQMKKIEQNMKQSACDTLDTYLRYVALYAIVSAVVEVRSTGNLDTMLQRIANSRAKQ